MINPTYRRIYQQLTLSSNNYRTSAAVFANKTQHLSISPRRLHYLLVECSYDTRFDLHRAGLVWGAIDANLTNVTASINGANGQDDMAAKFFFGFSASKLGKHWNRTITNLVKNDPFDYESIVNYLSIINDNIYDRWYVDWYYAVYGIYYILDDTISSIFPGDVVPENYTNIYDHLNKTRFIYSDLDSFSNMVDSVKDSVNLTDYLGRKLMGSIRRDNSSTGFLWGMFNHIISNGTVNQTVKNTSNIEFLKGILGRSSNKEVQVIQILEELKKINEHEAKPKKALYKIAEILSLAIEDLFPLVGYGYRYGIEVRAIPDGFQEAYERIKRLRDVCASFREIKHILKGNKEVLKKALREILENGNWEMKGQMLVSIAEFVEKNAKNSKGFLGI